MTAPAASLNAGAPASIGALATRLSPTSGADDTMHHLVACHDDNISACGLDVTTLPWTDEPIDCVVCVQLDSDEPEFCTCRCCNP